MSKSEEKEKSYPVADKIEIEIIDQSEEVIGYKGSREGTIIAKGWHNNYATFEIEGHEGSVTCIGANFIIEIGKRRFALDLKTVVNRCYEIACETPEESFEKKKNESK